MKYLIILLFFIALWFVSPPGNTVERDTPHIAYIKHFLRLYDTRRERALEVVPTLEKYSSIYGFDPLIPTVVISCESAWKSSAFNPENGEFGLMQVHGLCAKGYNLATIDGQLESGIACLAMSRDACDGSLKQTITMFMSGKCKSGSERTKAVVARRVRIIEKWRGEE